MFGGNITFTAGSLLTCPADTVFNDAYNGLYGAGAFVVSAPTANCQQYPTLQTRLLFSCLQCDHAQYTLRAGASVGAPNATNGVTCDACPTGGVCLDGSLVATAGYWGGVDSAGVVTMALCPGGYCCDENPCTGFAVCLGHRVGQLCGSCAQDHVAAIGAEGCVPVSNCDSEQAMVWLGVVVAAVVSAFLQLGLVSDVWFPATDFPSGRLKLVVYFVQVPSPLSPLALR